MDFNKALEYINDIIQGIDKIEYDGIIVKKLEASNTLAEGRTTNQTHIALTGEQMNIFPYLTSEGYFNCEYDEKDEMLKKYFVTQIPVQLYSDNIIYLQNDQEIQEIDLSKSAIKKVKTSVVRSRRKGQADQVQLSLLNMDSPEFVEFRKSINISDFLVVLKHKEQLLYDFIVVKKGDATNENANLLDLNNKFFKLPTNTKVEASNINFQTTDEFQYEVSKPKESLIDENENEYGNNPYQLAAKHICEHVSATGFEFDVSEEEIRKLYQDFYDKFSPEKLEKLPDDELLKSIFYSGDNTNDSLCYWLEFHLQNRKCFGSIAGGSSYKFGLFQRKEDGVWVSGSPSKPQELTDEDALKYGCEIRDYIIKGAKIIENAEVLSSVEDYEKLDNALNGGIGKYASFAWIHKYYCMIFPSKFATWHSTDWQNHMLFSFNIKPSDKYYVRSGQVAIIAKYAKMLLTIFAHASYDRFGDIKQFCRIGTTDRTTKFFPLWKKENIVAIGWNEIDNLDNFVIGNDINKKAISEKLGEMFYPSDARTASRKAGELATFYKTTSNTIFVAADGETLLALGDNVGKYFYDDSKPFAHRKSVNWKCCFTYEERLPNKTEGLLTSCYPLTDKENLLYLYHKYYYETDEVEVDEVEENKEIIRRTPRTVLIHPLNQIIYGAPGTGKTYSSVEYALAIIENRDIDISQKTPNERAALMQKYETYVKSGQITFTTFHQSYGYEEFIQGIRPNPKAGTVSFDKADGIFKRIADKALRDNNNNYVIIIDEINRGNISKVFGELITLIEEDKRFGEINQLSVTLPLGDNFTVPNNLYIIGTMNSADKSISLIDTALRRRFAFVEMAPNEAIIEADILKKTLVALNLYLRKELRSTDLLVGHSYFMGKTKDALGDIMNRNIIPLLYEYFYEDEAKVKKALDCLSETDFTIDTECNGRIKVKRR